MKKIFIVLSLLFSMQLQAQEQVKVITSIKPLQLVAHELLGELAEVDVLIPAGASPHHYHLKPSDRVKLAKADLVVWVGPDMETFLSKPLQREGSKVLTLMQEVEGAEHLHEHHEQEAHDEHQHHEDEHEGHEEKHHEHDHAAHHDEAHHKDEHEEHEEHHEGEHHKEEVHAENKHDEHHHDHGDNDPHIWFDPALMIIAADKIKDQVAAQHPEHKALLEQKFAQFVSKVEAADQQISKKLAPVKDKGFVVFHDAFSLFVDHYGLNQLAYFTIDPSKAPGAKRVAEIQNLLTTKQAACVFVEPQFEAAIVERITDGINVGKAELDPLAIANLLEQGYSGFILHTANQIETCLK